MYRPDDLMQARETLHARIDAAREAREAHARHRDQAAYEAFVGKTGARFDYDTLCARVAAADTEWEFLCRALESVVRCLDQLRPAA